jgi:hypothetical protein
VDTTAPTIDTTNVKTSVEDGETALGSVSANEIVTWQLLGKDSNKITITDDGVLTLKDPANHFDQTEYTFRG